MNRTIKFGQSHKIPALGLGTWHMGMNSLKRSSEANAIRLGLDLGLTLVDTAEMYHDAEKVVAKALAGRRQDAYVVSKVLPSNASLSGTIAACERSLKRLKMECIDLYLLHWTGSYPLSETLEAFETLVAQGKILEYGVSNFDTLDMQDACALKGGGKIATNQVLYNLECRGIEWDLLPWCRDRNIPVMAYSPLNQGNMDFSGLDAIARRHNVNSYQIALAWVLHQSQVCVIPKSANPDHVRLNVEAANIRLDQQDMNEIDRAFPPPSSRSPLEII